jgi:hypothetical protein
MSGLNAFNVRPVAVRIGTGVVSGGVVSVPYVMRVVTHEARVTCDYFLLTFFEYFCYPNKF